jgi:hypothetical protein
MSSWKVFNSTSPHPSPIRQLSWKGNGYSGRVSGTGGWYRYRWVVRCAGNVGTSYHRQYHQPCPYRRSVPNAPTRPNQYPSSYPLTIPEKYHCLKHLFERRQYTLVISVSHCLLFYVEFKCPFVGWFRDFARISYQPVRLDTSWKQKRNQVITSKPPLGAPPCSSLLPPKPG